VELYLTSFVFHVILQESLNWMRHLASFEVAQTTDPSRLFAGMSLLSSVFVEFALRSCRRFLSLGEKHFLFLFGVVWCGFCFYYFCFCFCFFFPFLTFWSVLDATFNIVLALDLEVDPSRFPAGFSVQKAVSRTLKVLTDLTERVKLSVASFPAVLRLLLRHVEKEVSLR
jgi:hypothetical protein